MINLNPCPVRPQHRQRQAYKGSQVSPLYGLDTVLLEILVGKAEVMVAEETAVSRQRRRVCRAQYEVARLVYQLRLALRIAAPKYEHEVVLVGRQHADNGVGELLPAVALVASGGMGAHSQCGVKQQNALFCPPDEASAGRHGCAEVCLYLLEYVDKRRRKGTPSFTEKHKPCACPGSW